MVSARCRLQPVERHPGPGVSWSHVPAQKNSRVSPGLAAHSLRSAALAAEPQDVRLYEAMQVALIGPFDKGFIDGFAEAANVAPFTDVLGPVDVQALALETLVQSGLDRLELIGVPDGKMPTITTAFMKQRLRTGDGTVLGLSTMVLQAAFAQHLPKEYSNDPFYRPVVRLLYFLATLFAAAHHKRNIILFSKRPSLEVLEQLLPTELLLPVKTLFGSMTAVDAPAAAQAYSVERRSVAMGQELLNSRAFNAYVSAHAPLADTAVEPSRCVAGLSRATSILTRRNRRLLRGSSVPLSLLPLTAKVADLVSGGLLGRVGDSAVDILRSSLAQKRRVVIYDHSALPTLVMKSRLHSLVAKRRGSSS
jgi:hypothetical protein